MKVFAGFSSSFRGETQKPVTASLVITTITTSIIITVITNLIITFRLTVTPLEGSVQTPG